MPSYQHNLTPITFGIKVSLTWTFCMNPKVDSYRTDAPNLTNTETTNYIKFEYMVYFNGALYLQEKSLSQSVLPQIFTKLASGPQ